MSNTTSEAVPATKGGWMKLALGGAILLGLMVAFALLPVKTWINTALASLQAFGPLGLFLIAVAYVPACILMVPGSALTLGAGAIGTALFPNNAVLAVAAGTVAVSVGSVTGATAAFLLGRTFARETIAKRVAGNAKFSALDEAIGKDGLKMTFLVRLSPAFPFNLLNYAMGLTKVSLRDYVLGSWAGMLPGTVMYVYLGAAGAKIAGAAAGGTPAEASLGLAPLIVGGVATIVLVVFVTRQAKKALDAATAEAVS